MSAFDWTAFWAMGGYAVYVWPSVGAFALGLLLEWVGVARRHRRAILAVRQRVLAEVRGDAP